MSHWPLPLKIAAGALGLGAVGLIAVLAKFWGLNIGYFDRFFFLAGAAVLAYDRREELAALPLRPFLGGWPLLALGAVAFPVGWFLQAQVAPKPVIIWWLTLAWIAAAVGLVLVIGGLVHLRKLAFPLVFMLFAVPMPNRIHVPLQGILQRATTTVSEHVLPVLGVPVEREGFILRLPGGDLGVAEACSGVKSVTILSGVATLIAYLMGFSLPRGLLLLGLSILVIAAVNAFRVVLSGLIQEWFGPQFIQGDWHEALGLFMVTLGIVLEILLARLIQLREAIAAPAAEVEAPGPIVPSIPIRAATAAAVVLALAVVATGAAQYVGQKVEAETVASAPLENLPAQLGNWKALPRPKIKPDDPDTIEQMIPEFVPEMLTYDTATCRIYRSDLGTEVDMWVIFWSSQSMVKGYHHPDICVGNRGFAVRDRDRKPLVIGNNATIPVTVREFVNSADKTQRKLIYYWTQEGRRVWSEEDEKSAMLTGDSHRWLSDRLFGGPEASETGRIVVLISTTLSGDGAVIRKETMDFTRRLADALYEICPWAQPQP